MQRIKIILHEEVPPDIVQLVRTKYEPLTTIDQVIFTRACEQLEGHMAVFVPASGSVIIDLDACVNDTRWMKKGSTFIANAWFNLLYCIYHEAYHAQQVEIGLATILPDDMLETHADQKALEYIADWTIANKMPGLEEMGYIGSTIKSILNQLYHRRPELVDLEIEACGKGVAIARVAASNCPTYGDERSIASLETAIDEGRVDGMIINNTKYLLAHEFTNLYC